MPSTETRRPRPAALGALLLRRPEILLLAMAAALWGWTYGRWDLQGADEARYVQIGRELVERGGNPFLLTVAGEPYDQKPPLPFWMFAAMYRLAGDAVTPWTARLPSILLAILSAFCVASMARNRFGERAGLLAGVLFMTSPLAINQAPTARLDMLFTGWITLCLWAYLTRDQAAAKMSPRRAWLFWGALAAAFFTKGPLALIIAFGVPLWESRRDRSWAPWRATRPALGLPALLALIVGWFLAQAAAVNGGFVLKQIWAQTYHRVHDDAHANPFWYYAQSMVGGVFMPWTLFLPWVIRQAWRERRNPESRAGVPFWAWIIVPLILLHLAKGKRQQYLVPLIPPIAILTAVWLDRSFWDRAVPRWASRSISAFIALTACGLVVLAVLIRVGGPLFWAHDVYPSPVAVIVFGVCAVLLGGLAAAAAYARGGRHIVGVTAGLVFILGFANFGAVEPSLQARVSTRAFSQILDELMDPADPRVGGVDEAAVPKYHVYGRHKIVHINVKEEKPPISEWPAVIAARKADAEKRGDKLKSAGYEIVFEMETEGDPMTIFRRRPDSPPAPTDRLKVALAGDSGAGIDDSRGLAAEIAKLRDGRGLDAVFLIGSKTSALADALAPAISPGAPIHSAPGGAKPDSGGPYYTIKYGDLAQFFVISSGSLECDPVQVVWLRAEMANSKARWRILLLDDPLDGSKVGRGPALRLAELLKPIISGPRGAQLVFAERNHLYERRVPLGAAAHITLGSGGKSIENMKFPPDARRAAGYAERAAFGWIEATPDKLVFEAINDLGESIDKAEFRPDGAE